MCYLVTIRWSSLCGFCVWLSLFLSLSFKALVHGTVVIYMLAVREKMASTLFFPLITLLAFRSTVIWVQTEVAGRWVILPHMRICLSEFVVLRTFWRVIHWYWWYHTKVRLLFKFKWEWNREKGEKMNVVHSPSSSSEPWLTFFCVTQKMFWNQLV